ncbi:Aminopeptidase 2 mitochondrial [Savitreella phatthalungensis]
MSTVAREVLRAIKPRHYDLHLRNLDFERGAFQGRVAIRFEAEKPLREISLNAVDLDVQHASVGDVRAEDISYTKDDGRVHLKFPKDVATGELSLVFAGQMNDLLAGFYRAHYTYKGEKRWLGSTQMEAIDCRRAFPCCDQPDAKATFDVTITADRKYTVLSNMPVKKEVEEDDGQKTTSFETTPIMSTYLIAWVVGELEYLETFTSGRHTPRIPVRMYTTAGLVEQGKFSLDLAAKTLDYFAEMFDIPYDLPKLDMIGCEAFAAGAMENWGLITYRQTEVLIDEAQSGADAKERVAETVQHELAHQWFGNLVTFDWWRDLWLNEGFATFISKLSGDAFFPNWRIWDKFVTADMQSALTLDGLPSSHPIDVPINRASEVDQIFDAISYLKGAMLIRMLCAYLGQDVFLAGVRHYLKRHKYGNTVTSDLWKALSEVSGKDVASVADVWTSKVGYPVLNVTGTHLEQHRFLSIGEVKPEDDETIYWVPLEAKRYDSEEVDKAAMTVRKQERKAGLWKYNTGHTGIYRVNYSPDHLLELARLQQKLSVTDRAGLLADAGALAAAGYGKSSALLALMAEWKDEPDFVVWSEIAARLSAVTQAWAFESDETLAQLRSFKRKLVSDKAHELGYDFSEITADNESDFVEGQFKALMFELAADSGDEKVVAAAKEMFAANNIPPNLRSGVYRVISREGTDEQYKELHAIVAKPDLPFETRLNALRSLGASKDAARISSTLDLFNAPYVKNQDVGTLLQGLRGHRQGIEALYKFLISHWEVIDKRLPSAVGSLKGGAVKTCLLGLTDESYIEKTREFFADKDCSGFDRLIEQAYDAIRSKARWVRRDADDVKQYLDSLE